MALNFECRINKKRTVFLTILPTGNQHFPLDECIQELSLKLIKTYYERSFVDGIQNQSLHGKWFRSNPQKPCLISEILSNDDILV